MQNRLTESDQQIAYTSIFSRIFAHHSSPLTRHTTAPPTSHDCMFSDEEIDPLTLDYSQHRITQPPLQNLLFPRSRAQMGFMQLPSPSLRRNSSYRRLDSGRRRTQALLERNCTPAHSWEKYRKSDVELRGIKSKKVRQFYENQVAALREFC